MRKQWCSYIFINNFEISKQKNQIVNNMSVGTFCVPGQVINMTINGEV